MARQKKIMTSYSPTAYPILVEECVSFRLPYGGGGPNIWRPKYHNNTRE
jgi:hypothetical protein